MRTPPAVLPSVQEPAPPYEQFVRAHRERIRGFYDRLGRGQLAWNQRCRYVRARLVDLLRGIVQPGARVLDVGCGTGDLLDSLEPGQGVGVDCSPTMVQLARQYHPTLHFVTGYAESLDEAEIPPGPYDHIILANVIGEFADIGAALRSLHGYCSAETRVIIVDYSHLWTPLRRLAGRFGLRLDGPKANRVAPGDMRSFLHLAGFEPVRQTTALLLPVRVPALNWLVNSCLGRLPGLRSLGLLSCMVARPIIPPETPERYLCSVVVPCRNQEDTIEGLVARIPEMGAGTEIIFVDDQSTDRTPERVRTAMVTHPHRRIRLVSGPGQGKGAACRAGFAVGRGDVFITFDASQGLMPEELPAFFDAITSGRGEFIHGSRAVYAGDSSERSPRRFGCRFLARLLSLLMRERIRDPFCGTKACWRRDYNKIMETRQGLGLAGVWSALDWLFGAVRNHLKIVELSVHADAAAPERSGAALHPGRALGWLRVCWTAVRRLP